MQKAKVFSEHLLDTFSVTSQNSNLNLTEISAIDDDPIPDMAVEAVIKDIVGTFSQVIIPIDG